ncbi:hypothetical protein SHKM778_01790 [Streptomyces sp. KM77-8]|uniref:Uncharacterized protein n=1 Tax=Streptomyces haneummycinicus TaxID=3074435 RepID=A0AAT9H8S1_9ACTN
MDVLLWQSSAIPRLVPDTVRHGRERIPCRMLSASLIPGSRPLLVGTEPGRSRTDRLLAFGVRYPVGRSRVLAGRQFQ